MSETIQTPEQAAALRAALGQAIVDALRDGKKSAAQLEEWLARPKNGAFLVAPGTLRGIISKLDRGRYIAGMGDDDGVVYYHALPRGLQEKVVIEGPLPAAPTAAQKPTKQVKKTASAPGQKAPPKPKAPRMPKPEALAAAEAAATTAAADAARDDAEAAPAPVRKPRAKKPAVAGEAAPAAVPASDTPPPAEPFWESEPDAEPATAVNPRIARLTAVATAAPAVDVEPQVPPQKVPSAFLSALYWGFSAWGIGVAVAAAAALVLVILFSADLLPPSGMSALPQLSITVLGFLVAAGGLTVFFMRGNYLHKRLWSVIGLAVSAAAGGALSALLFVLPWQTVLVLCGIPVTAGLVQFAASLVLAPRWVRARIIT
ncbi:MAG: hypothetical protein LBM78_00560 [Clostridiales bacterium]|jgi:hypothetical protein|nr:hypothetical protein [Clostridiales bacterium]